MNFEIINIKKPNNIKQLRASNSPFLSWHLKCSPEGEADKNHKNRREEQNMLRIREILKAGMVGVAITLLATPAFARSIELKGASTALWIFLIVGAVIVLLQLIPAAILFFSFIGTATTTALKKEKKVEEEVAVPGAEPVAVKK
jgi:hypothetical protein